MLDQNHQIVLEQLLGEGSFGRVYRGGCWLYGGTMCCRKVLFNGVGQGVLGQNHQVVLEQLLGVGLFGRANTEVGVAPEYWDDVLPQSTVEQLLGIGLFGRANTEVGIALSTGTMCRRKVL